MVAEAIGSYVSGDDSPLFVLSVSTFWDVYDYPDGSPQIPGFALQSSTFAPSGGGANIIENMCGFAMRELDIFRVFLRHRRPGCFYRLVYRRQHGTLAAPALAAGDGVIVEGTVDSEHEERRLMATEASIQHFSVPDMRCWKMP